MKTREREEIRGAGIFPVPRYTVSLLGLMAQYIPMILLDGPVRTSSSSLLTQMPFGGWKLDGLIRRRVRARLTHGSGHKLRELGGHMRPHSLHLHLYRWNFPPHAGHRGLNLRICLSSNVKEPGTASILD
jgi:hypothetical protein